jgi:putative tryptophan/tyrosine transport system substrate-binding protein
MFDVRRREFITLLGGGAFAWPLAARAQQPPMPVIGYFSNRSPDAEAYLLQSFRKGLQEAGYIIDQNAAIELRFSEGREDLLPGLAADLVRRQVSVLVANDPASALSAKAATSTIPIVFASGRDPVEIGLVASLNRPAGNATGVYGFITELGPKRLHLLRELVPNAKLIAFVANPSSLNASFQVQEMLAAAQAIGQSILVLNASNDGEIDAAFATVIERKAGAIIYAANTWFQVISERLVALAARHAIPAMYEWREFVTAGGLISYNTSRAEFAQQIGVYVGRILKGAKPEDLPVVQSSKFELVINLKTAMALGLAIPDKLLALADEVIE